MKSFAANLARFILIFVCVIFFQNEIIAQLPSLITGEQNQTDSASIQKSLKRKMFIKVELSKNKIFVGEPLMALYKFYTAVSGHAVVLSQPQFTGCSVKELNFGDAPESEIIDGKTYTVYVIRKVQLTPVGPGLLSIGVATISDEVDIPDEEGYFSNRYNLTITNPATSVEVSSLPEKNKPEDFYGITGLFNISASATENKIPVNENDHLIVTISGAGNLDAITKPNVNWPAGTEHFDGNDSQHVNQNNFPISGNRVFDIPFIGKKEGLIKIPPISFSYFNTSKKNYETITTDTLTVRFTKALSKKDQYTGVVNYDISNRKYLWIVPAIAVVVATVGFISYKKNKKQLQKKQVEQPTITPAPVFEPTIRFKFKTDFSRYWSELENITDTKSFFAKAKELLLKAVSERTDSNHHSETFLIAALKEKADPSLCSKTFNLLQLCDEKMYAPFESETDLQKYFSEIKETVEQLQAEI